MTRDQGTGNREQGTGARYQDWLRATLTAAADAPEGGRVIRGRANSFKVMRSGRLLHPRAFDDWLKRGETDVPLMANHGHGWGGGMEFATIGRVTQLEVREDGLHFSGAVAEDVDLADDAWQLIRQKMLRGISVGWISKQSRYVNLADKDIDPDIETRLKEADVTEALVCIDAELIEISLVDVPDDRDARLAARGGQQTLELRASEGLSKQIETALEARFTAMADAIVERITEATDSYLAALHDPHYGAALLDDGAGADPDDPAARRTCGHGKERPVAEDTAIQSALQRVRQWQ